MGRESYFDHAATTPLDSAVFAAMRPWMEDEFANANSIHSAGLKARAAVDTARTQVAVALGVDPDEIVFTSGATEANNWVANAFERVRVSPIEHSSLWERLKGGAYAWDQCNEPEISCCMAVNNETGGRYRHATVGTEKWHCDLTQAVGKIPIELGFEFASFSAHKFYGPKGVGALYAKDARFPLPLLIGGEHEMGHRAGTLNVGAIVGMGEAISRAIASQEEDFEHAMALRNAVKEELSVLSDWQENGLGAFPAADKLSPFILNVSFLEVEGEATVIGLDHAGFAISSGAACSSWSNEPSHVLTALGLPIEWLRGSIRISFGRSNTVESARSLAKNLILVVENLRKLV
ncbi:MAG: cysteine desulfurase family protein [Fimbriimonadaceae bacterium]